VSSQDLFPEPRGQSVGAGGPVHAVDELPSDAGPFVSIRGAELAQCTDQPVRCERIHAPAYIGGLFGTRH